jgi:hypothetical protein
VSSRPLATDIFSLNEKAVFFWAAVASILLGIGYVSGAFRKVAAWVLRSVEQRLRSRPPRDTMRVVETVGSARWHEGTSDGQPTTQLGASWLVTNPMTESKTGLVVVRADLKISWPKHWRLNQRASLLEWRAGPTDIPWGATREIHGVFWLVPHIAKDGKDLHAAVVFTDQFQNKKRVRVRFRAPRAPAPTPELRREQLYTLTDPLERDVAAVLQAELARYRTNGRREGGLGSIRITHEGRDLKAAGDFREVGTPRNQLIVADPDRAEVESDNAESLFALYGRLAPPSETRRFEQALIQRADRALMYAPVAYLGLFVALQCGFAPEFMTAARANLAGDSEFGFSNCLMLLDTLLRLKYPDIPDDLLDEIERFVHESDEHPFAIPERIAAICAARLAD